MNNLLKKLAPNSSINTFPKAFLPSVSFLIEKNHLNVDIVSRIPASGPKNNLLKGDILKFLQQNGNGSVQSIEEILANESYYQFDLKSSLGNSWLLALKSSALVKKLASAECTITTLSKNHEISHSLDIFSETTAFKKFDRIRPGSFRFVNCVALGPLEEAPTFHITSGEAAVLSVHKLGYFAPDKDLDYLIGPVSSPMPVSKPKLTDQGDLIDFLTSTDTQNSIRLELTVDSRVISEKVANQFLLEVKNHVDQH